MIQAVSTKSIPAETKVQGNKVSIREVQPIKEMIEPKETKVAKEDMKEVIEGLNQFLQPSNTSLRFNLHEKTNEYYVELVDNQTKEVIREIPSKKMLDIYAEMASFVGMMFDKKM